jgi:hypothetical protein
MSDAPASCRPPKQGVDLGCIEPLAFANSPDGPVPQPMVTVAKHCCPAKATSLAADSCNGVAHGPGCLTPVGATDDPLIISVRTGREGSTTALYAAGNAADMAFAAMLAGADLN